MKLIHQLNQTFSIIHIFNNNIVINIRDMTQIHFKKKSSINVAIAESFLSPTIQIFVQQKPMRIKINGGINFLLARNK